MVHIAYDIRRSEQSIHIISFRCCIRPLDSWLVDVVSDDRVMMINIAACAREYTLLALRVLWNYTTLASLLLLALGPYYCVAVYIVWKMERYHLSHITKPRLRLY
jgi:hypothetical protein